MKYTTDYVDAKGNLTHPDTEYEQTMQQIEVDAHENVDVTAGPMIRQNEEIKDAAPTPQFSDSSTQEEQVEPFIDVGPESGAVDW